MTDLVNTDLVNLADYESRARELLDPAAYDYIAGGADAEVSLALPRRALDAIRLRPRVMVDVTVCDLATTVLGTPVPAPILVAPSGDHGIAHPDGELATARGAAATGTLLVVSSGATYPLEDIAAAADGPRWLHVPLLRDRAAALDLVRRGEAAGYTAVCLTVDHKVMAKRERNIRNRWTTPPAANLSGVAAAGWDVDGTAMRRRFDAVLDRSATWSYVDWLAERTPLPIVAKGILAGADADLAVRAGAAAVVVSDHGGRQLDTAIAPIEALPEVVAAVGGRAEVYVDGGFRRGTDVLKALALGARAVLLGRPVIWGLAAGGADGVAAVLLMVRDELERAMAMCGLPSLAAISPEVVKVP
nr:alpha-hydroxy acid oxidase [Dactylosporangium thailandense]